MNAPWMIWASAQLGVAETPGAKSTPAILAWAKRLGAKVLGAGYTDDAVPWCGLFAAAAIGSVPDLTPPPIALRAKSWATWGEPSAPCYGAVLVFERQGGGHVGFCEGHDATAFHVLGGNQGDKVSVARIEKSRCVAVRWPTGWPKGAPLPVLSASSAVSSNEA